MLDSFNRNIDYMRISITDRCNLRCRYCMPEGVELCTHNDILSFDEIVAVCREAVKLGIVNFKITGGEPLVRRNCSQLIKDIFSIEGVKDVTLTTNGILLEEQLDQLVKAGVKSINVSLDTVNREKYKAITGFDKIHKVKAGIEKAVEAGVKIKINAVLHDKEYKKDFQELIDYAKEKSVDIRFIEMMPIGFGSEVLSVSNNVLMELLLEKYHQVDEDSKKRGHGPAKYYKIPDYDGRVGFISAIHGIFCDSCNRIRMSSTGEIKSCLCFNKELSLKEAVRNKDCITVGEILKRSILDKPEKHCFDEEENITEIKKMIQIGG